MRHRDRELVDLAKSCHYRFYVYNVYTIRHPTDTSIRDHLYSCDTSPLNKHEHCSTSHPKAEWHNENKGLEFINSWDQGNRSLDGHIGEVGLWQSVAFHWWCIKASKERIYSSAVFDFQILLTWNQNHDKAGYSYTMCFFSLTACNKSLMQACFNADKKKKLITNG